MDGQCWYPIRNRAICEAVSYDGLNWEIVGFSVSAKSDSDEETWTALACCGKGHASRWRTVRKSACR